MCLVLVAVQVDMEKVCLDTIKPWISEKITKMLGIEDDVVIEFIFNMLENERVSDLPLALKMNFFLHSDLGENDLGGRATFKKYFINMGVAAVFALIRLTKI